MMYNYNKRIILGIIHSAQIESFMDWGTMEIERLHNTLDLAQECNHFSNIETSEPGSK